MCIKYSAKYQDVKGNIMYFCNSKEENFMTEKKEEHGKYQVLEYAKKIM